MGSSYFKFKSVGNPEKYGYEVNYDRPWYGSHAHGRPLASWAGMFDTYGDGLCQHSPAYAVQVDRMEDFLISLACHLEVAPPDDLDAVVRFWGDADRYSVEDLEFARKLKWNEKKRTFYNLRERKVSGSDSKQYDTRWHLVSEWMKENDQESMYRVLTGDNGAFDGILRAYGVMERCGEHLESLGLYKQYQFSMHFFEIPSTEPWALQMAWAAVDNLVKGKRLIERAKRSMESYGENMKRRKEAMEADMVSKLQNEIEMEKASLDDKEEADRLAAAEGGKES